MARTNREPRASPYRGEDRRAGAGVDVARRLAMTAAAILIALWLAFLGMGLAGVRPALDIPLLSAIFDTTSVTVVVLAGIASFLRWRLSGETPPFFIGLTLMVYGVVALAGAGLVPLLFGVSPEWAAALYAASSLTVVGLLLYAVRAPTVDTRLRPGRVVGIAATAIAALAVFSLMASPGAVVFVGTPDTTEPLVGAALLGLMWVGVASLYVIAGARRGRALFTWLGIGLAGLALVEVTRLVLGPEAAVPAVPALRAAAFLAILVGASLDLQLVFTAQRGSMLQSALTALSVEARQRANEAASRRWTHDALNALTAIQGASQTLERYQDRLDATERATLAEALQGEIDRLQSLVASATKPPSPDTYPLGTHLAPMIADLRAGGALVDVTIPPDLRTHGRWADTAEAVRVVLQMLRAYAPARRLIVSLDQGEEKVELRVEHDHDGAADVPREPVEALPDGGLELRVAADLVRKQGGDLLVEHHGNGLAFVFLLPVAQI